VGKDDWKIIGTYYLDKMADGSYHMRGSVKVDVSESSPVFQSVSRLNLTFFFFQGDVVIHEETVRLKGEANEYIKFSQKFDPGKELESTAFAWYNFRVSELPVMGAIKKPAASEELNPRKTYIRIESTEQIYEDGQPKFIANPGEILEVIRVKTCISGSGTCWQVRNNKTGETGFRRADVMKQRHTVYEVNEESTSKLNLDELPVAGTELSQVDFTGSYRMDLTGNLKRFIERKDSNAQLVQRGKTVTGTFGDGGQLWGEVDENIITFDWVIKNAGGTGKWSFDQKNNEVVGSWFSSWLGDGNWSLTRIE
jgi:hypothetical protein